MAQKVQKAASAAEDSSAAEELQTLSGEARITLAGRELVVREYDFFEGLEVAHRAAAFIAAMHEICRDGELRYDRIRRLFGVHKDVVIAVAAQSAGVEPTWLLGLKRQEIDVFMSTWFAVNSGFFVHEVVVEMREDRQRAALRSIGMSSSSDSPNLDSATSSNSDTSPNGS